MSDNSFKERRFIAMRTVLHAVSLSLPARMVYWELDERSGYKAHCWPKQETIAAMIGISVRAVRDGLNELVDRGFVRVERHPRGLEFFLSWSDRQNMPVTTDSDRQNMPVMIGNWCRSDRQNMPVYKEQYQEPQKEQRCSLCGGSGYSGGNDGGSIEECVCQRKTA